MTTDTLPTSSPTSPSRFRKRPGFNGWAIGTVVIATSVTLPLVWVVNLALSPSGDIWAHLVETILTQLVWTTFLLMAGVGFATFVIGTTTAWLVTMCKFPGQRFFAWALLIPMAVPAYVIAYVYTDLLEYAGPLQVLIRDLGGLSNRQDYWFPNIRSLGGAVTMMTLVLYPYVYLLARSAFANQSVNVLDAARTLGHDPWQSFFKVALPLARPAIAVGVSLVMMETLNDYGTVDFFAVATFSTAIFDVWLNLNSPSGAAQLALVLLAFVTVLVSLERYERRHQKFHQTTTSTKPFQGYRLPPLQAGLAFLACAVPLILGFVLPAWVLGGYALDFYQDSLDANYLDYVLNSLSLSALAALIAVITGIFLAYSLRLGRSPWLKIVSRLAALGYAVPGAVLAIGIVMFLGDLDNIIDGFSTSLFGLSTGLVFSGTMVAVTFAYVTRFLSLSFGSTDSGLAEITPSMDGAARTLGAGPLATLRRVHLPMLKNSILTAALLVFVDCMKELPMTTILRPFNFETLATFVHQYASDELLPEASLAALTIVATGIIPVILLSLSIAKPKAHQEPSS